MAAPIAHIFCALVFLLSSDCPIKNKKAFLVGTSFPDIRYIGHLKREQTHWLDLTIEDIKKEQNAFMAGMKFHSWVDETRIHYLEEKNLDYVPDTRLGPTIIKFFEDTQLYDKVNWSEIIPYFDDIQKEELDFDIPIETLNHWHQTLQEYFAQSPSIEHIQETFSKMAPSEKKNSTIQKLYFWLQKKIKLYILKKQLIRTFTKLENNDYVKDKIAYFYEHLDDYF